MEKSLFANPHHMAIIVRDMDKSISYYKSLGMGPFEIAPPIKFISRTYCGQPVSGSSQIREVIGYMGKVRLQLIQPLQGKSIFQEFLDTRGEGVHHYAFLVDNFEKVEAQFKKKGVEILSTVKVEGGGGHVIVDSAPTGGIYLEFIQSQQEWLEQCPPSPV
jgi:methylmalonyl-CoA/ethylmalonyl-CoA epimerase